MIVNTSVASSDIRFDGGLKDHADTGDTVGSAKSFLDFIAEQRHLQIDKRGNNNAYKSKADECDLPDFHPSGEDW